MLASELFALSQGCTGPVSGLSLDECHWCGAPCERIVPHDDVSPRIGIGPKFKTHAKRPGNGYVCRGCLLWRRQRTTVDFLGGGYGDGQTAKDHPWFFTSKGAWVVGSGSWPALYEILLDPPCSFVLSLLTSGQQPNLLQEAVANDNAVINGDTPLSFTVNNIRHSYTVYDLQESIKRGNGDGSAGVTALFRFWQPPKPPREPEPVRPRGRPAKDRTVDEPDGRVSKQLIRKSGGK